MIQRDFIQRLIHQISAVLARMIGKNAEEQLIILEEYIQQHNGLGSEDLEKISDEDLLNYFCLLYTSPSPRDQRGSRMPSSA